LSSFPLDQKLNSTTEQEKRLADFENFIKKPILTRKYSAASRDGDDEEDDSINFQTLPTGPKAVSLKVQRPISSRLKGHTITPLSTCSSFRSKTVPNLDGAKISESHSFMKSNESDMANILQRSKITVFSDSVVSPKKPINEWPKPKEAENMPLTVAMGDSSSKKRNLKNPGNKRPPNLNLQKEDDGGNSKETKSQGVKPFFVWLMDRLSPN